MFGTESVESIAFYLRKNMPEVTLEAFRKMSNLRLIYFFNCYKKINGKTTHLCFKRLKYMYWEGFPLKSLDNIEMCNVVVLKLTNSKLERLWEGMKSMKKLRVLNVSGSMSLTKTGNLSGLENLEELDLSYCRSLKEIDSSIGDLKKLAILDLRRSIPLKRTPWEIIGKLPPSLQKLTLGYDVGSDEDMESVSDEGNDPMLYSFKEGHVTTLYLYGCNPSEISSGGVVTLASLKHLYLRHVNFSSHCDILLQLHHLNTIELEYCHLIQSIPNLPPNIASITANQCSSLVNLPCNISELKSLTGLTFLNCPKLGSEDPHFLMKVTGLTNLTHLTMIGCSVSQVPNEIGNLVSLKKLILVSNPFSRLPDTLSNLSQLHHLNIDRCKRLRLLPLLPPNLTYINARCCDSLDVTSSASQCTKMYKESPFSNGLMVHFSWQKEVPEWCSYQSRGDALSFVAPLNLEDNICGIILYADTSSKYYGGIINPAVHNKTKNTSHRFKDYTSRPFTINSDCMCVMSYPLNDTTLLVEPGDSVVLEFPQGSVLSCGLCLIYESDMVDSNLVTQTATEPTPHIPSEAGVTQLHAITNHSQCDDHS